MKIYVVLDTNVIVASMLTRHHDSATRRIINAITDLKITVLYHEDILTEYRRILNQEKFGFPPDVVQDMMSVITTFGIRTDRTPTDEIFNDKDDVVFYEVALSKTGAFVVTGNKRHFPDKPIVVTPAEMVEILENNRIIEKTNKQDNKQPTDTLKAT